MPAPKEFFSAVERFFRSGSEGLAEFAVDSVRKNRTKRNPIALRTISQARALLTKFRSGLDYERLVRSPLLPPVSFLRES